MSRETREEIRRVLEAEMLRYLAYYPRDPNKFFGTLADKVIEAIDGRNGEGAQVGD